MKKPRCGPGGRWGVKTCAVHETDLTGLVHTRVLYLANLEGLSPGIELDKFLSELDLPGTKR